MLIENRPTAGRGRLFESVVDTIGDTPCIQTRNLGPRGVRLYVKAEYFNPAGSIKDRLAISIIEEAEKRGELKPGQTVIEATSGNTGLGLAMVCASKGYPLVVTMLDSYSIERRKLMRFLGAKVVLVPAAAKGFGQYQKAKELAAANGWFMARQFETKDNAKIHENTTAREILSDFRGDRLDYVVSGYGTGGTLTGVARTLRRERPDTKIVMCEPDTAQIVASGAPQQRHACGEPAKSHAAFRGHKIQGWTPDFIPLVLQEAINDKLFDEIVPVSGAESMTCARDLAQKEGILTGISGGATFAVALKTARAAAPGSVVLCMLPDAADRYISSELFDDVAEYMTDEEKALSRSTPGYPVCEPSE